MYHHIMMILIQVKIFIKYYIDPLQYNRELTTQQSILQNQVEEMVETSKEGAIISVVKLNG